MPPNGPPPRQVTGRPSRYGRAQRKRGIRIVLTLLIVMSIPIIVLETPREISRWHQAAAIEKYLNDDLGGALASLEKAREWNPNNMQVLHNQAAWKLQQGDVEGSVTVADLALEKRPDSIEFRSLRAEAYQRQGKHREAIQDWLDSLELNEKLPYPENNLSKLLNGLAYCRAVAGLDLAEALQNVKESLEKGERDADVHDAMGLFYSLHYGPPDIHRRNLERAGAKLGKAVELVELEYRDSQEAYQRDPSETARRKLGGVEQRVGIIRVHHAEVLRLLGKKQEAVDSDQRAADLGADLDKLRERMEDLARPLAIAMGRASKLDTRGFLHLLSGNLDDARQDMELAVEISEMALAAWQVESKKNMKLSTDLRKFRQQNRGYEYNLSVILYHRGLVYEKLEMKKEAQADFDRVKKLGYSPGDDLY